jgi:hypothetical protein
MAVRSRLDGDAGRLGRDPLGAPRARRVACVSMGVAVIFLDPDRARGEVLMDLRRAAIFGWPVFVTEFAPWKRLGVFVVRWGWA